MSTLLLKLKMSFIKPPLTLYADKTFNTIYDLVC